MTGPLTLAGVAAPARQQPVTQWPERLLLTALTVALILAALVLMRRGWHSRGRRQQHVPPLPDVPTDLGRRLASAEGIYVSTTSEGDWLDRIVVHGLGVRSEAVLTVADRGVLLERVGAPDVFVPAPALAGVRLERGMAGKFVEEGGLVVLTWRHGDDNLDTGFRPRHGADRDRLVDAATAILTEAR